MNPKPPLLWQLSLGLLLCLAAATGRPAAGGIQRYTLDGHPYYLYLPPGLVAGTPAPLVVVLHGCLQDAAAIARITRFDELADREGFVVLYPQTGPSFGNPNGCWVWWEPGNQRREGAEPALVVNVVKRVSQRITVDKTRIYVAGLSSGAALAAILGSVYPDVFAAAGAHSGLEYSAAATGACALTAMRGVDPDARTRGALAYQAQGRRHRVAPLIVIQGRADSTVAQDNADALITQFAAMNDYADDGNGSNGSFDARPDAERSGKVPDGYAYTVQDYQDAGGQVTLRRVLVEDLGHAWSGGPDGEAYSDPRGPDATRMLWDFFRRWSLSDPPIEERPAVQCSEHYASNAMHYWWYHRMESDEYWCDPWSATWRHGFDHAWGPGRCPQEHP